MDNLDTVMTRDEAIAEFEATELPGIIEVERSQGDGGFDEVMRSEAWNNYTDDLHQEHRISDWQYNEWTHPDSCNS